MNTAQTSNKTNVSQDGSPPLLCGTANIPCASKSCSCGKTPAAFLPGHAYGLSSEQIQEMIRVECIKQSGEWTASLVLPCLPLEDIDPNAPPPEINEEPSEINVCDYFGKRVSSYSRLNFSREEFPPFKKGTPAWDKLKTTIERASYNCNSPVICKSGTGAYRLFVCQVCNTTNKKNRSEKRQIKTIVLHI